MDKDTTLICTIGDAVKIFHFTEAAKDKYENKKADHEVVVMDFTDEDFKRLADGLGVV